MYKKETIQSVFFSIVIPTYSRSQLCLRAVLSVLKQSYPYFECIVVDDHSTDDTLQVIREIEDKRVCIYQLEKNSGGSSIPINFGVSNAQYAYVAFLDSDDYWKPDRLEKIVQQIRSSESDIGLFYSSSLILYSSPCIPRIVPASTDGYLYPAIKYANLIGIASRVVVKKEIFQLAGGFDEKRYMDNDWECWIRICKLTKVKSILPLSVIYTENVDSISSNAEKVIRGRSIFLEDIHGKIISAKDQEYFNFQLVQLLLSRGNLAEARQLVLSLRPSVKKYSFLLLTVIPALFTLNCFAFISYFKYILLLIKKGTGK